MHVDNKIFHKTPSIVDPNSESSNTLSLKTTLTSLLHESTSLNPELVRVQNYSTVFQIKKILGSKKYGAQIVKRDKSRKYYRAQIYDVQKDTNYALKHKVYLKDLGIFPSKVEAFRECYKACVLRDLNTDEFNSSSHGLGTHYNVLIVSDKFCGLSHFDRMWLVYEALINEFIVVHYGLNRINGAGSDAILTRKMSLMAQVFSALPFELLLDLQSPSQWKVNQRHLLKNRIDAKDCTPFQTEALHFDLNIGLNSIISLRKNQPIQQRGIKGHFFHGLKPNSSKVLMEEYTKNTRMIHGDERVLRLCTYTQNQVRGRQIELDVDYKKVSNTLNSDKEGRRNNNTFKKNVKKGETKIHNTHKSTYKSLYSMKESCNTDSMENEIVSNSQMILFKRIFNAIKVQRIFRLKCNHRMKEIWVQRQFAALTIQRIGHGYIGRLYAKLFRDILIHSSIILQSLWRGIQGRKNAREQTKKQTVFALAIQPVVRGWLSRKYLQWAKLNHDHSIAIQKEVRGFFGRCIYKKLRVAKRTSFLRAYVVKIQSFVRKWFARIMYKKLLAQKRFETIILPSIVSIQSYWRRFIEQTIYKRKKWEEKSATKIQKLVKGHLQRNLFKDHQRRKSKLVHSIKIQFFLRQWIYRQIAKRKAVNTHRIKAEEPAIILIQAFFRACACRRDFRMKLVQGIFATKIQKNHRRKKLMQRQKMHWIEYLTKAKKIAAIHFQRVFRGWRARQKCKVMRLNIVATKLLASQIIKRKWFQYKEHLENFYKKLSSKRENMNAARKNLERDLVAATEDLEDIKRDIHQKEKRVMWLKERLSETDYFLNEGAKRIASLKRESNDAVLTKDETKPIRSILSCEYEKVGNQIKFCMREQETCVIQIRMAKKQIEVLYNEYDDVSMDLDRICGEMMENFDMIHKKEIETALKRKDGDSRKLSRREITRWKVKEDSKGKKMKSNSKIQARFLNDVECSIESMQPKDDPPKEDLCQSKGNNMRKILDEKFNTIVKQTADMIDHQYNA